MSLEDKKETKVAVVILNYNGKPFLEKFLLPVVQHSKEAEIWIVDNCSTDDSVAFLQEHFPELPVIQIQKNEGFSKGYNLGLAQINADYYVLLNSDVEVTPHWIEPIIRLMDADSKIGACQPKIKAYHKKEMFEYAGGAGGFIDRYGYPFCRGRIFDTVEKDEEQYNQRVEIFWASGAAMFIRASVYWEMGGLENDFFAHMEEIDLCWRIQSKGYKIYYVPESVVYHVGGGTLKTTSPFKTYLNFRNNLAMLYKNIPSNPQLYQVLTVRFYLDGLALLQFLLKGNYKNALAIIKAYRNFYVGIARWRSKRRLILKSKTIPLIYPNSIVWAYFARGIKKFKDLKWQ